MNYEYMEFPLGRGILIWLGVMAVLSVVAFVVGTIASLGQYGASGPARAFQAVFRGIGDLVKMSARRIGAIAVLTFKESQRRKAFMIGVLFLLLYMFGGWFLGNTDLEKPAKPYVSFVMWSMEWLLLIMSILIACWGLPADIKAKSIHTVVTKPVRRSEIVVGRMFGYSAVVTLVLIITAVLGYFWIQRQVPDSAKDQLIARVPVFGTMSFLDRNGVKQDRGINVGDIWEYRSYIEGLTKARAIWKFNNLDVNALKRQGKVRLEQSFEAFRTFKGDVREQVHYSVTLVNPTTELRVKLKDNYAVHEHAADVDLGVIELEPVIEYNEFDDNGNFVESKSADLFDDVFDGDELTVEIACVDSQQYIGAAKEDLFVRLPDRSFLTSYSKAVLTLWMMLVLVVCIGTTASCFLKGPVATMLTTSMIVMGQLMHEFMSDMMQQLQSRRFVLGGGAFESMYRLITRMNVQTPLPDNMGANVIQFLDARLFEALSVVFAIIPNFTYFNSTQYVANGFDVPWEVALEPSLASLVGYAIPLIILGYFSLQLRELESK